MEFTNQLTIIEMETNQDMSKLERAMGGKTEIQRNSDAFRLRTENCPLISKETQPILHNILENIAEKEGCSVEELQQKY